MGGYTSASETIDSYRSMVQRRDEEIARLTTALAEEQRRFQWAESEIARLWTGLGNAQSCGHIQTVVSWTLAHMDALRAQLAMSEKLRTEAVLVTERMNEALATLRRFLPEVHSDKDALDQAVTSIGELRILNAVMRQYGGYGDQTPQCWLSDRLTQLATVTAERDAAIRETARVYWQPCIRCHNEYVQESVLSNMTCPRCRLDERAEALAAAMAREARLRAALEVIAKSAGHAVDINAPTKQYAVGISGKPCFDWCPMCVARNALAADPT